MLGWILELINPLSGIAKEIARVKVAEANAEAGADRQQHQTRRTQLEARAEVIKGSVIVWMQVAWALPYMLHDAKAIVWDKMFHLGVTGVLSPDQYQTKWVIISFIFLTIGVNSWRKGRG